PGQGQGGRAPFGSRARRGDQPRRRPGRLPPGSRGDRFGPGLGAARGGPCRDPLERRVWRDPRQAAPGARRQSPRSIEARLDLCYKSAAFTRLMHSLPASAELVTAGTPPVPKARIQLREEETMRRELLALAGLALLLAAAPVQALGADPAEKPVQAGQAPTPQAASTPQPPPAEDQVKRAEEVTVESASKVEQKLIDAPATMSVVTSEQLAAQPAQNMADTLRSVPGMNVIQMSARDINLTARQATSTLATSQLVSVDGRSVYLDFFGLVLWDLVPSPTSGEIKQIEVVRGPASVVWGANAVNGVVNIITKTPRENEGFGVVLGAGLFNRDGGSREGDGDGYQWNGSFSYAHAINDKWSYRLNAGYFQSDPYSRPTGTIPLDCHPFGVVPCRTSSGGAVAGGVPIGGATYPTEGNQLGQFQNEGTQQPKFGLRFDQEFTNGGRMTYEGGYYGTEGIVHTGIGPFRLESGSYMAFGRVSY